jgi:enterochelin esterase-like enzyme
LFGFMIGVRGDCMDIETYQRLGLDKPYGEKYFDGPGVNGRSNSEIADFLDVPGDKAYHPCPEAYPDERVPTGNVIEFSDWGGGRAFSQTKRNMWVYVPQHFDPDGEPPALMIFNDGEWYLNPEGAVRATKVLDSLIHAEDIPITVAIFVNPGRPEALPDVTELVNERRVWRQRSIEYDSVTETYGRFLIEDVIPFVEDQVGFKMSGDPKRRTTCGISSGGICAFNTAWHFPEAFGCVLSHVGSFVNLRGGHQYPYLVRSTPRKPIRVFLQEGRGDVNIVSGNWVLANQQMASALEYAGYDMRFDFGEGGHSLRHGGAIFAESLRWLARE